VAICFNTATSPKFQKEKGDEIDTAIIPKLQEKEEEINTKTIAKFHEEEQEINTATIQSSKKKKKSTLP
jgi:hypothetical protein